MLTHGASAKALSNAEGAATLRGLLGATVAMVPWFDAIQKSMLEKKPPIATFMSSFQEMVC